MKMTSFTVLTAFKFFLKLSLIFFISIPGNTQDRSIQEEPVYFLRQEASQFMTLVTGHDNLLCRDLVEDSSFNRTTLSLINDNIFQEEIGVLRERFEELKAMWNTCLTLTQNPLLTNQHLALDVAKKSRAKLLNNDIGRIGNDFFNTMIIMILFGNVECMNELRYDMVSIVQTIEMSYNFQFENSYITEVLVPQLQSETDDLEDKWNECVNR